MIYFLKGILDRVEEAFIILDVNGIGYQVFIPSSIKLSLPSMGSVAQVYTFCHQKEDQQVLYGFLSADDREFFSLLTRVSGIGPKIAVRLLSDYTASQVTEYILGAKIGQLIQVSGLGKKTAERLVLELKDKIPNSYSSAFSESISESGSGISSTLESDLILALKTLGYHADEIKKAMQKARHELSDSMSLELGIKIILKYF